MTTRIRKPVRRRLQHGGADLVIELDAAGTLTVRKFRCRRRYSIDLRRIWPHLFPSEEQRFPFEFVDRAAAD